MLLWEERRLAVKKRFAICLLVWMVNLDVSLLVSFKSSFNLEMHRRKPINIVISFSLIMARPGR